MKPFTKQQSMDFYKEANDILELLKNEAQLVLNELDVQYGNKKKTMNEKMMAKVSVVTAFQLARQSLHVFNTNENFLILSCLGCRSLIEHEINVKYTYCHPKYKRDKEWTKSIAKSYWRITRLRKENKAKLGGISIRQRAKEVRRLGVYNKSFSHLTGITHNTAVSSTLIEDQIFYNSVIWIGTHVLIALNNAVNNVANFHNIELQDGSKIETDIKSLSSKYKIQKNKP